ncbi:arylamine N-acetyltransferase [Streptomyces sp. NBC_00094]|uniref:arylamine N-acetyltransferase family protein n=1 Tax=Streptomyces sp. NBC_00094 TaxID=2903620 RepID=UPI0022541E09|nr:arylamine N-acetyltransferase [Streptomyces sp. NBC_00094]MCX5390657.1 arylamine N-acetyltransferase [Streptomyces sp. NBC_00094]
MSTEPDTHALPDHAPSDPVLPDADAYLARIGAGRPVRADAAALRELHVRHLRSVPFENLSIHLGEDIVLDEKALIGKVVGGRRGGFCYEINTTFAVLLRELGYRVSLLQARVIDEEGRLGIPYDHMALLVETADGERWLADVGFGDHSHYPLAFDERGDQEDPGGCFRVQEAADGDLDVLRDGKPQYRLEPRPRELADFTAGAWYHRTSPDSHFPRSLVCSLLTEDGRITLSGRKLVTRVDGERVERLLEEERDEEVLGVYRDLFGIVLDALPVAPEGDPETARPDALDPLSGIPNSDPR